MFERFKLLVGNKFDDISKKKILIIGLGGVGSYVVESLVRCGISSLTLVDNDQIDITNLNRQLMTNKNNIGKLKTEELYLIIKNINENCQVSLKNMFVNDDNINELITDFDYVVDACDTVKTKLAIIRTCNQKKIKLISAMGTGNKMNPSLLEITDIYKTNYDPLAKIIRSNCRKMGIKKLTVVCSREKPIRKIKEVIPSNSFVPASAGLLITSYIINDIVGDLNV